MHVLGIGGGTLAGIIPALDTPSVCPEKKLIALKGQNKAKGEVRLKLVKRKGFLCQKEVAFALGKCNFTMRLVKKMEFEQKKCQASYFSKIKPKPKSDSLCSCHTRFSSKSGGNNGLFRLPNGSLCYLRLL